MKKHIYLLILLSFSILNFSYGQQKNVPLKRGDTILKRIKLSFNQTAIKQQEFVIFKINDDFDFDNLILLKNGKKQVDKTFRVYAKQENDSVTIEIIPKQTASGNEYHFSAKISGSSRALDGNILYQRNDAFSPIIIAVSESPIEQLIKYGSAILIALLTCILLYFLYRNSKKFTRGILSLKHPDKVECHLKNYSRKFSYKDVFDKETSTDFYLTKGRNGNPKIYTSQNDVTIEVENEIVANGYLLRAEDEVRVSDDNNNYIKFIYN